MMGRDLCFLIAYQITSCPRVLAWASDSKNPDLYYCCARRNRQCVWLRFLLSKSFVTTFLHFQLEFRVDEKKLREVFRVAGQVVAVEICRDSQGSSRGFGTVIYSHPLQAVQAISMLNNQTVRHKTISWNIKCCVFWPANACLCMCSHGWKQ